MAISDVSEAYYKREGLDIGSAIRYTFRNDFSRDGFGGGDMMSHEQLLELDVNVLIPAALGGVINDGNTIAGP